MVRDVNSISWLNNETVRDDRNVNHGYTKASIDGWYNTTIWRKLRLIQLEKQPLCVHCEMKGKLTPAEVVDHIRPVKGTSEEDWLLFISEDNLQSLCEKCHRRKTNYDKAGGLHGMDLMNDLEN